MCFCSRRSIMTWVGHLFVIISIFIVITATLCLLLSQGLPSPAADCLHRGVDVEVEKTNRTVLHIMESDVVTMGIVVIGILGVYGGLKRNLVALIVFLGCTVGSLTVGWLMVRDVGGVPAATVRPQLESMTEEWWRSRLPLDQASDDIKNWVEGLQSILGCCGIFSYKDWEDKIPDSCLCIQEEKEGVEGLCQTVNYSNFLLNLFWQKKSVFSKPCFPIIMISIRTDTDIAQRVHFLLVVLMVS
ncbi:uncharacterized protein LOC130163424 isoform X2 [Seriola aureovittata]|uniref:uncharacterized protein LOC130163424 isoform X2 n=1 Tax=Seriola aureovittata TaxID=2871759 RepID=UPI0024BD6442|nr:uncharacterized protein LOC130163424 isoform X2 [Seriola aureovittata]